MLSSSTEGTSRVGGDRFTASVVVSAGAGPCHDIRETPSPDGEGPDSRLGESLRSVTKVGGVAVTAPVEAVASEEDCEGSVDGSGDVSGEADDDGGRCCCCCCCTAGGVLSLEELGLMMGLGRSSS